MTKSEEADILKYVMATLKKRRSLFGIRFKNPGLLEAALTHPSSSGLPNEGRSLEFQRLEFFGDSILNFTICKKLFTEFSELNEGALSRLRSLLVSKKILLKIAREIKLKRCVKIGKDLPLRAISDKTKILSDCLEAFIGALYLDRGMRRTEKFIDKIYAKLFDLKKLNRLGINPKNTLQEYAQKATGELPRYKTVGSGKGFASEVFLSKKESGKGEGRTKREAEEKAARALIKKLKIKPY